MNRVALSELLGAAVYDSAGVLSGRVRDLAVNPQDDPSSVASVIVKTKSGKRKIVPASQLRKVERGVVQASSSSKDWGKAEEAEGNFLLDRDLLDQQIIDVHGRKVVRVNDVDFALGEHGHPAMRIAEVDIGPRGAIRRLLKGVVPGTAITALVERMPMRSIPWDFVNLIETDPARRVHLKISHDKLNALHPADIADIIEDLSPAQREAVFESLAEEVAAETIEELDPKLQVELVESMDSERVADIVEEMDPDAAADLLNELTDERSEEILEEMEPEEREEVEELLEHREDTAAGRMTTEYLFVGDSATVSDAIEALRAFEGGVESVSTVYLIGREGRLAGAVPLAKIVLAPQNTPLTTLTMQPLVSCTENTPERDVIELFDKYNLSVLPVVDENGCLTGVITADDIISLLRHKADI